jgi:chromosome transmission fidelity protein 1
VGIDTNLISYRQLIRFVGRAIRHKEDWASLILIDQRYATSAIRAKLPEWIGSRLFIPDGFGQVMRQLGQFYTEKRE